MKLWRKPLDVTEKPAARNQVVIDKNRCKGCGYCVDFCPREVLKMSTNINPKGYTLPAIVDEDKCLNCGYCEKICPEFAVKITSPEKVTAAEKVTE
jgi:2-oxoglutarate ferredoxin oxidoreductase subunit delta